MRKLLIFFLGSMLMASLVSAQAIDIEPEVIGVSSRMDTSPPLQSLANAASTTTSAADVESPENVVVSWDGIQNTDNSQLVTPANTNIAVGQSHVVQMVNSSFAIWDKTGIPLIGPTPNNDLWSGFGGPCEFNNNTDGIVLYDEFDDRWVFSQLVESQAQCFAVSTTSDPTGTYHRYEFPIPGGSDTRLGIWPEHYLATVRNLSGSLNIFAVAFEREAMLDGQSAQMIAFNLSAALPNIDGFLPTDVDGPVPPAGREPLVFGFQDGPDSFSGFEVDVVWSNISGAHIHGPGFINVAPIDTALGLIPQPQTTQGLDPVSHWLMPRLTYRDLGTDEVVLATHTVDINNNDQAGVRWYEFHRISTGGFFLFQQGTYAPDSDHRWVGSIAMNQNGSILAGYSVSSSTTFPSIRYSGRNLGDPLNQFTIPEGTIVAGQGSQTGSANWGEYTSMVVDPSDDETFWYTNVYYSATSGAEWSTKIASLQAPPTISLTATPDNPPVIIPTTGGSFDFSVSVTNNSTAPRAVEVWTHAERASGGGVNPIFGPGTITLASGETRVFNLTQTVPGISPSNWTYFASAGTFPNPVIASDSFPFEIAADAPKTGTTLLAEGADEWEVFVKGSSPDRLAEATVPEKISLEDNYPNPFNPTTTINYSLNKPSRVTLKIYNLRGQEVKTLVNGFQSAGFQTVKWDATNNAGQAVAGGVYLYRLEAGEFVVITKKMTLMK